MSLEKRIQQKVGKALEKHSMIDEGDRLLIAISGGKDSMSLAKMLTQRQRYFSKSFELVGCHIVTDLLPKEDQSPVRVNELCSEFQLPLERRFVPVLGRTSGKRPMNCFFCAMQRRMELVRVAKERQCNKIAYGHNLDDIIETLLMNMFYNAEISTMPARLELDNHDIVIVRPLCFVKENELKIYAERNDLTEAAGTECRYGYSGRRARVKKLIEELAKEDSGVRNNLSACLERVKTGYLGEKIRDENG